MRSTSSDMPEGYHSGDHPPYMQRTGGQLKSARPLSWQRRGTSPHILRARSPTVGHSRTWLDTPQRPVPAVTAAQGPFLAGGGGSRIRTWVAFATDLQCAAHRAVAC